MLVPTGGLFATPPTLSVPELDIERMQVAIQEANQGMSENGIPIGAALVRHRVSSCPRAQRLSVGPVLKGWQALRSG